MCIRQTPASAAATASIAPGAVRPQTSLIIDAPAASAARITAGLRVSTDTATPSATSAVDQRDHPGEFLGLVDRLRAGPRRLAADVDQVRPVVDHPPRMLECARRR